jgi:hypothetical protein
LNAFSVKIVMANRRSIVMVFFILGLSSHAFGQNASGVLRGSVLDEEKEPLPRVNVALEGTYMGSVTGPDGRFVVSHIPPGAYTVVVSIVGYKTQRFTNVAITAGGVREIHVVMTEALIELAEVQVTGQGEAQAQNDTRTSLRQIPPDLSKALPGFGEDVLRSLQAMPGVVAPSDFSAQLVIRGSGPDQNLIVMDDIEIFNPYRLYGLISMFNPETVSDISLITGAFPAPYGDRLSAVLDVTNREGGRDRAIGGSLNASITNANIVAEGAAPFGVKGSYLFSARRTYYDLIVGPIAQRAGLVANDVALPNFSDLQAKIVLGPFDRNTIVVNGLISRDGVDIVSGADRNMPDSVNAFNETNHRVLGFAWHAFPTDDFASRTVVSFYQNDGVTDVSGEFLDPSLNREEFQGSGIDTMQARLFGVSLQSQYELQKNSFSQVFLYKHRSHLIEGGFGADFLTTILRWDVSLDSTLQAIIDEQGVTVPTSLDERARYNRYHAYVQDRLQLGERFTVEPGLRYDYYDLLDKAYVSPRLTLSYALDEITTLRAGFGLYYQSPGYEKLVDQQRRGFVQLTDEAVKRLEAERATHLVAGFDRWITEGIQVRTDAYFKKFDNLIEPRVVTGTAYVATLTPGTDPRNPSNWSTPSAVPSDSTTTVPDNNSYGTSYGVEILLEKRRTSSSSRLYGWMSYALAWAHRHERERTIPFDFDQRHSVNVVLNYRLWEWFDVGLTWRYGSNFPYTPALGVKPRIMSSGNGTAEIQTDASGNVIFDVDRGDFTNVNTARKPAYHRLDVRLTAYTTLFGMDASFYLDVINVYNHSNVLTYNYYITDSVTLGSRPTTMFPILPTLGMSLRF